jgi:hypothetical protein
MLRTDQTGDDAFGPDGLLRDGAIYRVRMSMRDTMRMRDLWEPTFDAARHRPGFRVGIGNRPTLSAPPIWTMNAS